MGGVFGPSSLGLPSVGSPGPLLALRQGCIPRVLEVFCVCSYIVQHPLLLFQSKVLS